MVGEFIVQNETTSAIAQGLAFIKEWMKTRENWTWAPRHFMTDFCEQEISAIEKTFPGKFTIVIE